MKETEITVQVFENETEIDTKLKGLGYSIVEVYQMEDTYYTSLGNAFQIPYEKLIKHSFLVRKILDDNPKFFITYKDKVINDKGEVIQEEKTNLHIDSIDKAIKIFDSCGLNKWCSVNTTLTVYKKDNVLFSVQVVENLGVFIEYEEDETMKDLSLEEKRNHMKSTLQSLGLTLGDNYSCKKVYMLYQKKNKRSL